MRVLQEENMVFNAFEQNLMQHYHSERLHGEKRIENQSVPVGIELVELEQVGSGSGAGYTVNIPLPAGTGDRGYRAAFEQLVLPIGLQYRPQLIIVSAGQDASWLDPLAHMCMTMAGFRTLTELVLDLAHIVCEDYLVVLQDSTLLTLDAATHKVRQEITRIKIGMSSALDCKRSF